MLIRARVMSVHHTEKGFAGVAYSKSAGHTLFSNFGYRKPLGLPAVPGDEYDTFPPMPNPNEEIVLVTGRDKPNHAKRWTICP